MKEVLHVDQESNVKIPEELKNQFMDLHQILKGLRNQDILPALRFVLHFLTYLLCLTESRWARDNKDFLKSRNSPLEFYLHRSQYIRLLLSSHPPDPLPAIAYAKANLQPFFEEHTTELQRLMSCIIFLPLSKLQNSTYRDLASPTLHFDLEPLFAKEYCAHLGMSKQLPLRVVGDIGAGGALARIEKGRKALGEMKNDWSQMDELPVSCWN